MIRFVGLKDAAGVEHLINVDYIIRLQPRTQGECTVVVEGCDIIVTEPMNEVWKKIFTAAVAK